MTSTTTAAASAPLPRPRWRLPIIGDLLTVDLAKPCQGLARESTTLGGIFEEKIFNVPVVVVSDVEPFSVVAGVPARFLHWRDGYQHQQE